VVENLIYALIIEMKPTKPGSAGTALKVFNMLFQDCFYKCIFENLQEIFLNQTKYFSRMHKVINENSRIETFGTKVPVCPWCGEKYQNYQDFSHKEITTFCCKRNCDNEFKVIRIISKDGVRYNSVKKRRNS